VHENILYGMSEVFVCCTKWPGQKEDCVQRQHRLGWCDTGCMHYVLHNAVAGRLMLLLSWMLLVVILRLL
jgi:hypothetical protein